MLVLQLVTIFLVFGTSFVWFLLTNTLTPYSFIDEEFHVPAAQRYCQGNLTYWDNKITTPPGLYLNAMISNSFFTSIITIVSSIFRPFLTTTNITTIEDIHNQRDTMIPYFCTLPWLRLWSYIYWLLSIILIIYIIQLPIQQQWSIMLTKLTQSYSNILMIFKNTHIAYFRIIIIPLTILSLSILTFSPLWITTGFVYTESSSLFWLLYCKYGFISSIMNNNNTSSIIPSSRYICLGVLCGILSLLYRQTNILWYTYILLDTYSNIWIDIFQSKFSQYSTSFIINIYQFIKYIL